MNSDSEQKNSDQNQPKQTNEQVDKSGRSVFKGAVVGALSLILSLIITFGAIFLIARRQYRQFLTAADISHQQFLDLARSGWKQSYQDIRQDGNLTLLILGIDSVANRSEAPPLTDTIMLVSIQPDNHQIKTLSLPRDLWSQSYQTKINALYTYGSDRYPNQPEAFPTTVISDLTGTEIDYTLVLSLEQLGELIDLVNGVEVTIEQGFTDSKFPRSDVDIAEVDDPDKLYETVTFEAGTETMKADRALKYIRSRHSGDQEGTDLARSRRQQQIIDALIDKIANPRQFILNPSLAGRLFQYYQQNFDQYLPTVDLATILFQIGPVSKSLEFKSYGLPVKSDGEQGVIYHPQPTPEYQDQWIYLVTDQQQLKQYIDQVFSD